MYLLYFSVSSQTQPCQRCEVKRSDKRKWSTFLCVWIHKGKSLPADEEQVKLVIFVHSSLDFVKCVVHSEILR